MNDFTILHLSDLHLDKPGKKLSILMQNLIDDIVSEMKVAENIILVVTGDILHQAKYECRENAIAFFEKLKESLQAKKIEIIDVFIVPGNHDKIRNVMDSEILEFYDFEPDEFYKKYWQYLRMDFDEYRLLSQDIYKIFLDEEAVQKKCFRETYGVGLCEIKDKHICFLLFNTAWSSLDRNDERKLKIGKFQLEQIKKQYEQILEEHNLDLTIVLAHHPMDWLDGTEETMLRADLLSNNSLNANIYISGHTHNRDVVNWQNNRHSITSLATGLGWPDGNAAHPYAHAYSSYVFNLEVNSIDVYVRSSDDNYSFEPDFRIYTEQRNKEFNKIVMPINSCKTQAYFNIGTVKGRSPKACYLTDDTMKHLQEFVSILGGFRRSMLNCLWGMKYERFQELEESIEDPKMIGNLQKYFFEGGKKADNLTGILEQQDTLCNPFATFLQQICSTFAGAVKKINDTIEIRVHFRGLEAETDEYYQINLAGDGFENYHMDCLKWGELLEEAFEAECPLIASVNSRYCPESYEKNRLKNEKKTGRRRKRKWYNFMTVIPRFKNNIYEKEIDPEGEIIEKRPFLSFGITIYREEDNFLLYIADYFRIDKVIGEMIDEFLRYFPVDLKDYLDKTIKNRG